MINRTKTSLIIAILLYCVTSGRAQDTVATYELYETRFTVVRHEYEPGGMLFYNMHDNENTGVDAARKVLKRKGGVLYELVHSGKRNIEFVVDTATVEVDPNRIYTIAGVEKKMLEQGISDTAVFAKVYEAGVNLVELLDVDQQNIVITLHNNTNDNYSFESYLVNGEYASDAIATHSGRNKDPDEFYFVTSWGLFEKLKGTGFNIVLQDNTNVTDDGSLSVYCGFRGIEYVNIEAQHGHKSRNKKMIRRLIKAIETY